MPSKSSQSPNYGSMTKQAISLPEMISKVFPSYLQKVEDLVENQRMHNLERLFLFGSGDSNFVGLSVQYAFESIAALPLEVLSSLKFSRYTIKHLPQSIKESAMAIGISVSGTSSRTREGMIAARNGALKTIALSSKESEFTEMATSFLVANTPEFHDPEPNGTPGVRSFAANHLILLLLAIKIGEKKRNISQEKAAELIDEIKQQAILISSTISAAESTISQIVPKWRGHTEYVFVGAGPNYGSALFAAAKFIEANGDFAIAQETEEWAHLNYYNKKIETPTIVISGGRQDISRTSEILNAAKTIGRQTMLIGPKDCEALSKQADYWIEIPECSESIVPLHICALSSIIACKRSQLMGEIYFRENNTVETSRIRDSLITAPN
ncbi:hypothetical protein MLD52_00665 [Puniceicoccaceae bacterium K14]|nr:hypothetical protein [Puniceicoccaceae bacterium K14]